MSRYLPLLVVVSLFCYANSKANSNCEEKVSITYLDVAADMIDKARHHIPGCADSERDQVRGLMDQSDEQQMRHNISGTRSGSNLTRGAMDCSDLLQMGHNRSGVYTIWPVSRITEDKSLLVYCDMQTDGGGWTIIQRRGNYQNPVDYFFKEWKSYKEGFGDIEKEFWLGNDTIFALTNQKLYSARFDLRDVENNTRYAQYEAFWIDEENCKYTLHISNYSGDAGESLFEHHSNQKFSTKDQDNDIYKSGHCAQNFKGGWWYGACHNANLNGLNRRGKHTDSAQTGISWYPWKGYGESMESTEIKIRPKKFIGLHHVALNTPV